jgi:hypothetical protein
MKGRWIAHGLKVLLVALVAVTAFSFVVMGLWNWLVPAVIGWKAIDFWQALGLLVLTRLLFGFRAGFGFGHRMHWRGRMAERWERMTPEEREKFRAGMHHRCGHRRHGPPEAAGSP